MRYDLKLGQIVRHKGERKVVRRTYTDENGIFTIEFVDRSVCRDIKEIELDGRK